MTSIAGPVRRSGQAGVGLFWWLVTCSLALVLLIINAAIGTMVHGVPLLIAFVAASAQSAAIPLVLVRPVYATALQFGGVALFAFVMKAGESPAWPLTVTGLITLVMYIGIATLRRGWKTAVATWWASALLLILLVLVDPLGRGVDAAQPVLIIYPAISAGVLLAGLGVRYWAAIRRQLAEARRDVVVEQGQRAVVEERTRIARELHDVVAHNMSVIHMQATSAAYRIKDLDPESKAEFAQIAAGARATMREMRQLLAVLRDESADPELAPVPNLDRVDELAQGARQAGIPVSVRMADNLLVPETIGAAGYRIVQESLSNVIRHAPGARTSVELDLSNGDLAILVVNEPAALPATAPLDEPGRAGHGLDGMRERVRLLGGSLVTGPATDGGYRVAARLPIGGTR